MSPPRILIIAGSDSGGGAGIQADIKTAVMLGAHPMTAITALTAQNTLGVEGVMPVPPAFVLQQMDVVLGDIGADAVKIGMIGSAETGHAIADRLEGLDVPVIFDPVMVSSSGAVLADENMVAVFEWLMGKATLITPNAPELEALTGMRVDGVEALEAAGRALARRSGAAVLAKGGHLAGEMLTDILLSADGESRRWRSPRIETRHSHGTGCTLATAIACGLGAGMTLADAVERGRAFVRAAMAAAPGFGGGHGPMDHALGMVPFETIHNLVD